MINVDHLSGWPDTGVVLDTESQWVCGLLFVLYGKPYLLGFYHL